MVVVTEQRAPRLWGHDRPPADRREALDWTALGRLLGWPTRVIPRPRDGSLPEIPAGASVVVVACDLARVPARWWRDLAARMASRPLNVVVRATGREGALARWAGARSDHRLAGRTLAWTGPGPPCRWTGSQQLEGRALVLAPGTDACGTLDGVAVAAARPVGRGRAVTLGFHPSEARDRDGAATAFLVRLLTEPCAAPVAWLDHARTLVLRMDDPGGAPSAHLEAWSYRTLTERDWARIAEVLRARDARVSLAYVPGWVDDGDGARGRLWVGGRFTRRAPGRIHPSPRVRYAPRNGSARPVQDHVGEYRGIRRLQAQGLAGIELHGFTHLHPDLAAWSVAPDRYGEVGWYREFGPRAEAHLSALPHQKQPLVRGLALVRRWFGAAPSTLIFPGDERSEVALLQAVALGFEQVGGPDHGIRDGDCMLWASHVHAPYLDQPAEWWRTAGLPVVGYFHDRDVSRGGAAWLARWLDAWREAGMERFIDYRELASALGLRLRFVRGGSGWRLTVRRVSGPPAPRPVPIAVRWPGGGTPPRLEVETAGGVIEVPVRRLRTGAGRVLLPAG